MAAGFGWDRSRKLFKFRCDYFGTISSVTADLIITITSDSILLDYPLSGERENLANRIGYDKVRLELRSVGQSESTVKAALGEAWVNAQSKMTFTRIFDAQAKGPIFDIKAVDYLFAQARSKLYPNQKSGLLFKFRPGLSVELNIHGYERLGLGRQRELEYYLHDFLSVKEVKINQRDCTIPLKLRTQQNMANILLRVLLPSLVLYAGLFCLTRNQSQDWLVAGLVLLGGIAAAGLAYLASTTAWLLIFRGKLPHGYLRFQLRTGPRFLRSISRWVAGRLLD